MKYMKEQQMPWLGISYKGNFSEDFRKNFRLVTSILVAVCVIILWLCNVCSVSAVPLLKILTRKGRMVGGDIT